MQKSIFEYRKITQAKASHDRHGRQGILIYDVATKSMTCIFDFERNQNVVSVGQTFFLSGLQF